MKTSLLSVLALFFALTSFADGTRNSDLSHMGRCGADALTDYFKKKAPNAKISFNEIVKAGHVVRRTNAEEETIDYPEVIITGKLLLNREIPFTAGVSMFFFTSTDTVTGNPTQTDCTDVNIDSVINQKTQLPLFDSWQPGNGESVSDYLPQSYPTLSKCAAAAAQQFINNDVATNYKFDIDLKTAYAFQKVIPLFETSTVFVKNWKEWVLWTDKGKTVKPYRSDLIDLNEFMKTQKPTLIHQGAIFPIAARFKQDPTRLAKGFLAIEYISASNSLGENVGFYCKPGTNIAFIEKDGWVNNTTLLGFLMTTQTPEAAIIEDESGIMGPSLDVKLSNFFK